MPMHSPVLSKDIVARHFSHAAESYDAWAEAQTSIARSLLARLPARACPKRIADLGCGTGTLAGLLAERFPGAVLYGLDLAEGMTRFCKQRFAGRPRMNFVTGDAELPGNVLSNLDMVTCTSSAQWFNTPHETLLNWSRELNDGGILAVALLVQGSCPELAQACEQAVGRPLTGVRFASPEQAAAVAAQAGLRVLAAEDAVETVCFADVPAALRSFKGIGALLRGQPGHVPLTVPQMRRLIENYSRLARPGGRIPVSYRVHYCVAEKAR